ncbi:MAG: DNA-processing protein DprA [Candidatus Paceibacterota bacterium]|jgi:DNA processing protein
MSFSLSIITREEYSSHPLLSRLLELHDIPDKLYIAGNLPEVTIDEYGRATPRILAVIGPRKHTTYGKNATEKLISSLAGEDVIILSGLAIGIDGLAHTSALKNKLTTIAIPGSGLDSKVVYPRTHLHLAEEIVKAGGLLISELPPETGAAQWTFPSRNRLVAALSDAVLVIEAGDKSGALITSRQALELGRDIGAVPGEIFSQTSVGTNMLIRDGSYIVADESDLYALLHLSKKETKETVYDYSKNEQLLIDILIEPLEKDILLIKSKLSPEIFLITLSSLEMKGVIEEIFGEVRRLV